MVFANAILAITEIIAAKVLFNKFNERDFGFLRVFVLAFCNDVNNCTSSLHGGCYLPNTCRCNPGFSGDDCSVPTVCSHTCSEKGICIEDDSCLCSFDWTGSRCQEPSCESSLLCSGTFQRHKPMFLSSN